MLETSVSWPWFVMSLMDETASGPRQSDVLVSTSDDLRDLLVDQGLTPAHLGVLVPPLGGRRDGWELRVIRKVWTRPDPNHPAAERLMFEDTRGEFFTVDEPGTGRAFGASRLVCEVSGAASASGSIVDLTQATVAPASIG